MWPYLLGAFIIEKTSPVTTSGATSDDTDIMADYDCSWFTVAQCQVILPRLPVLPDMTYMLIMVRTWLTWHRYDLHGIDIIHLTQAWLTWHKRYLHSSYTTYIPQTRLNVCGAELTWHKYHLHGWHRSQHWNENVVILMKFSSLAAPKVVILTTFGAASDEDFVKMKTFPFQWRSGFQG